MENIIKIESKKLSDTEIEVLLILASNPNGLDRSQILSLIGTMEKEVQEFKKSGLSIGEFAKLKQ